MVQFAVVEGKCSHLVDHMLLCPTCQYFVILSGTTRAG